MQYGTNILALAATLNTEGTMSQDRIHKILGGAFGIPLAQATIVSATRKCAEAFSETYKQIGDEIAGSELGHFDETGTRVGGKTVWTHVAATEKHTRLYVCDNRGEDGMRDAGILPRFKGIAVTDCWSPYWKFILAHALCCAHLLRELIGVFQNFENQSWASDFIRLLRDMKKQKEAMMKEGRHEAGDFWKRFFSIRYDQALQKAHEENPEPSAGQEKKRRKRGKVLYLVHRLEKHKADICRFFEDFTVPFDNNEAERSCRIIKVKTKVSGCFRTMEGAQDFAKIQSCTATGKKRGIPAYEAIRQALLGNPNYVLQEAT